MDDPLVGLTIWQSAQQSKKGGVLVTRNELGVGAGERTQLLNGMGGGNCSASKGVEARSGGRSKRKAVGGETRNLGNAGFRHNSGEDDDEEEECELTESSLLCREGGGRKTPPNVSSGDHFQCSSPVPRPQNFWLMRLFESKLFNMSIAIGYFFKSKEADVQAYLGNKLHVS